MRVRRCTWIAIVTVSLVLLLIGYARYQANTAEGRLKRIRPGMTMAEVEKVMGWHPPLGMSCMAQNDPNKVTWCYRFWIYRSGKVVKVRGNSPLESSGVWPEETVVTSSSLEVADEFTYSHFHPAKDWKETAMMWIGLR